MMNESLLHTVQEQYGRVARSSFCYDSEQVLKVAQIFGYSEGQLASIPVQANTGLSSGNPVAIAGFLEREVVVDLGSGGGLDVFWAAKQVGPSGLTVGIDMNERAKASANFVNVEFQLAQIDTLPLADSSVDCMISNCVNNFAADKPSVFRENLRVLKPGG